jgi:type IV pilus assembly protein PilA
MFTPKKAAEKGFTLIELLVVVAIIGILATIGIAHYMSYKTKSINSLAESDLRNAITAEEAAYADEEAYASCSDAIECEGALPGFVATKESDGTSAMQIFQFTEAGESFAGSSLHLRGNVTYGYDSSAGVISKTEN